MTIDLSARPTRLIEWEEDNNLVILKILKFKGKLGKWFCQALNKPLYAHHHLDDKGSFIWRLCDGTFTVEQILEQFEKKYGTELLEHIEREHGKIKTDELKANHKTMITRGDAVVFLTMLHRQGYISYN